jgi:hypothetical protein
VLGIGLLTPTLAHGSSDAPPTVGSIQRRSILNAVRPAVEAKLGPDLTFVVTCLQLWRGWALVNAEPQRRGRPLDPRMLDDWDNRDGLTVTGLLRYRYGRWNLVDHAIGATDAWYDGVAPRELTRSRCY